MVCVPYPEGSVKQGSCVKCGRVKGCGGEPPERGMRRDVDFERRCVRVAHQAGELPVPPLEDGEPLPPTRLDWHAESRAMPGNVRTDIARDLMEEAREELADCRSYLVWRCQQLRDGFERGDSDDCREYAMAMRGLQYVAKAYDALVVPPA